MSDLRRKFFVACIGLLPLAAWPQAGACGDDFSGTALGAAWTFVDLDGETGGSHILKDGKLELSGKGGDIYGNVNEFVAIGRRDITGDFDISVKIESQANTHDWAQAGIIAVNDLGDLSKGGYAAVDVSPSGGFTAFWDSSGTRGTLDKNKSAGTAGFPAWIRLAKTGTKFSAWYRKQAQGAWLPIREDFESQGTAASSQIALFSLSHNDNMAGTAVFDDFVCEGATTFILRPARKAGILSANSFITAADALGRSHSILPDLRPSSAYMVRFRKAQAP